MPLLRLYYLLHLQVDGIQMARTSLIPALLGSFVAATMAMVLMQACSASAAAMATTAVASRLVPLSCLWVPRLPANGSSLSNAPKTRKVDMRKSA